MMIALDPRHALLWTVPSVCSPEECAALVARIEAARPAPAPVTTAAGPIMRPDIRNNTRVVFADAPLAAQLLDRVRPTLPASMLGMHLSGANERFRCYRYEPGQRFAPHYDGAFVRGPEEQSLLTFIVYLNAGFEGGETAFLDAERVIAPATGTALLFQHHLLHEGRVVQRGVKYVLRTDVMYARPGGR